MSFSLDNLLSRSLIFALAIAATLANAETIAPAGLSPLIEEVTITARKRSESAKDVPLSVSGFSQGQLSALEIRDLSDLSVSTPSVVLDDVGAQRGFANFAMRGLGINSTLPSIDPAVGIVTDGVFLGTNVGIVTDFVDVESIELLRGPQGTLFGRNVTGGAVLIKTKAPTQDRTFSMRLGQERSVEGGPSTFITSTVSGGLSENLAARLTVHSRNDDGPLEISAGPLAGKKHGAMETLGIKPVLKWSPREDTSITLRYELQRIDGDGPSSQAHTNRAGAVGSPNNWDRNSFDFAIDQAGKTELDNDFLALEATTRFKGGNLTYILGSRKSSVITVADFDSQPLPFIQVDVASEYQQLSHEVRWSGLVLSDLAHLTIGAFHFASELDVDEDQGLLGMLTPDGSPFITNNGGGNLDVDSLGIFATLDYFLSDSLEMSLGLRVSEETKAAKITSIALNANSDCYVQGTNPVITYGPGPEEVCAPDFEDEKTFNYLSPRISFSYDFPELGMAYASASVGFRSGGFNLRNRDQTVVSPGYDEERVNAFELGYKGTWDMYRFNISAYHSVVSDMQREVVFPVEAGLAQILTNTADAEINGLEAEVTALISPRFSVRATLGLMDAKLTEVLFDLNRDGAVNAGDKALDLPRAPELTYSLWGSYTTSVLSGFLRSSIAFGYRSEMAFTDSNDGFIQEEDRLDISFDYLTADGRWEISVYGRNILNNVRHGAEAILPSSLGGSTLSFLMKPAIYGIGIDYIL